MAVTKPGSSGQDTALQSPRAKADRRQKILGAALRLFSERPYDEIFADEIAHEAGVAKSLVFYYFKDKRGLYLAATQRQVDLEMAQWRDPGVAGRPRARIRDVLHRHFEYLERHR
jgi:AcrR family transcriptional regulator